MFYFLTSSLLFVDAFAAILAYYSYNCSAMVIGFGGPASLGFLAAAFAAILAYYSCNYSAIVLGLSV